MTEKSLHCTSTVILPIFSLRCVKNVPLDEELPMLYTVMSRCVGGVHNMYRVPQHIPQQVPQCEATCTTSSTTTCTTTCTTMCTNVYHKKYHNAYHNVKGYLYTVMSPCTATWTTKFVPWQCEGIPVHGDVAVYDMYHNVYHNAYHNLKSYLYTVMSPIFWPSFHTPAVTPAATAAPRAVTLENATVRTFQGDADILSLNQTPTHVGYKSTLKEKVWKAPLS